jgi:preprotein translocase subunit SecA
MDALRQAIHLRGYAQVDPKIEYKREGSQMFGEMQRLIAESVTDLLFRVRVTEELDDVLSGRWQPTRLTQEEVSAFEAGSTEKVDQLGTGGERPEPIRREAPKVGRNDPCPCGSGKKYKKCHGAGGGGGTVPDRNGPSAA